MSYAYVNLIVTLSSFVFLIPYVIALRERNHVGLLVSILVLVASLLQHVSETKHSLPGLLFVNHSRLLLNIDRSITLIAVYYGIIRLVSHPHLFTLNFIVKTVIGLLCNFVGENILTDPTYHMIIHPPWHCLAALCLSDTM